MVEKLIKKIDDVKKSGNYRQFTYYEQKKGKYIIIDGKEYLSLTTNDYLGLGTDSKLLKKFYQSDLDLNRYGFSTASSRLLGGNSILYKELEDRLSDFLSKEKTIVFNSGYHLNSGVLAAITDKRDLILSDKLNHASIVDGVRLSGAEVVRYRHLDYDFLEDFLQKNRDKYENVFIVTESLFSMDGDFADIKRIVEIKKRYDCFVYLDEAHSIGVYGEGRGLAYEVGCLDDIDIFVGTFGKAFSSVGGFVSTNDIFYDLIINYCRTLIFTTALPPVVINWNLFILNEMSRFNEKRRKLFENSNKLRNRIKELNLQTSGESYIIPIIIGDSKETITLFSYLKGKGILTSAVRPPTVPIGTARIRLSLNPLVDDEDIHIFIEALNLWRGKYEN